MTDLEIEKRLKESTFADSFIEKVLHLHRTYKGSFNEMIFGVRLNMKLFIDYGYSVIEAYEILKEQRVVRCCEDDSLIGFEKNLFKIIIECFTDWRDEVLAYELLNQIKIVNTSTSINVKRKRKYGCKI